MGGPRSRSPVFVSDLRFTCPGSSKGKVFEGPALTCHGGAALRRGERGLTRKWRG